MVGSRKMQEVGLKPPYNTKKTKRSGRALPLLSGEYQSLQEYAGEETGEGAEGGYGCVSCGGDTPGEGFADD